MLEFYLQYLIIVLLYAKCTAGILVNAFIVATSFQKWKTLKTLQTCDKILSCLAISRCVLLFNAMLLELLLIYFYQLFQNPVLGPAMMVGTMLMNNTNLWLTTILCVFICVKITNFNHKLFIFLKTRISSLVH
ncbi:hypothetical protein GDO78_023098 [Eleutherodactylus coqui]|uniref:Taste receptor type 2 member 40 n=1 Tax=Eleutherodactylus coqui TaxID=57060 RepID=A0A8J6EG02_ELECQ|nr:hypothetical protein GDO78_023098 [Eleutherodactylus coqui]